MCISTGLSNSDRALIWLPHVGSFREIFQAVQRVFLSKNSWRRFLTEGLLLVSKNRLYRVIFNLSILRNSKQIELVVVCVYCSNLTSNLNCGKGVSH